MKRKIKNFAINIIATIGLGIFCLPAVAGDRVNNGGDNIEPLFIQALLEARALLSNIHLQDVDNLAIEGGFRIWLKQEVKLKKDDSVRSRLEGLQIYLNAIELGFQEEAPCQDDHEDRGVCYDDSDPNHSLVIASRKLNRSTTPSQAEVILIHEAGHFIGEKNHLFLSSLGVALVSAAALSSNLPEIFTLESHEELEALPIYGFKSVSDGKTVTERCREDILDEAKIKCAQKGFNDVLLIQSVLKRRDNPGRSKRTLWDRLTHKHNIYIPTTLTKAVGVFKCVSK